MKPEFVYSAEIGTSADIIPKILGLYVPPGAVIADVTYDKGVFWRRVDRSAFTVYGSDIGRTAGLSLRCDARRLPYRSESLDVVVLDPPYGNASTSPRRDGISWRYSLATCMTPLEIRCFYWDGGKQHWMTIEVFDLAVRLLGFRGEGKINMVQHGKPTIRHPNRPQKHERKNHSVFWIFKKPRNMRRHG